MFMKDDKKKLTSLIVSRMGKKDESTEPTPVDDGAEQDDSMAVDSAAEELISAVKGDSAKGVVEAMKSLLELLDKDDESEEPPQA